MGVLSKLDRTQMDEILKDPRFRKAPEYVREAVLNDEPLARLTWNQWINENIWCPHCGECYELDATDGTDNDLVTAWGGDDIVEKECPDCEGVFYVEEVVRRTFRVGETVEQARGY